MIKQNTRLHLLTTCLLAGALYGCTAPKTEETDRSFVREDFKESKELKHTEEIVIDNLLHPASFRIMHDSILVASNQPDCEYLLELYSLHTLQPLAQLIRKGNGPDEMLSCSMDAHSNTTPQFYLQDMRTNTWYTVNIDSICKHRSLQIQSKFQYSSEVLHTVGLCPYDEERYIGYHMWYLDSKEFNNGIDSPISFYKKNENSGKGINDFTYFVGPANGALLFQHPSTKDIWALDIHRDLIRIYNDSLREIRRIEGPDHFRPQYARKESNAPIAFISFAGEHEYSSYIDYYLTGQHLYLVYVGSDHSEEGHLPPVEIFKLDFDGNLLCRYQADQYLYSISIDKDEKYLYAMGRASAQEEARLWKYELE